MGKKNKVYKCCANCKYWECVSTEKEITELSYGECHRYPPNVVNFACRIDDCGSFDSVETIRNTPLVSCPYVFASEWCGEFKAMKHPRWE